MRNLNEKYFAKAYESSNPLIEHLIEDYGQNFVNEVQFYKPTIICGIKYLAEMW
jgi:hypothetical protein